ncbi:MAG: NAD(P)(+) transhydrogenase (Re/Si-specific) subunit beta, partial [Phycisphaeraceae bacterium]
MTMHTLAFSNVDAVNLLYLLAAVLFILGLKMLSKVKTARRGNLISSLGMLIAAVATFFFITGGQAISLVWIALALLVGTVVGLVMAVKVPMTGMPQMVGLLNGFGGIASLLVACA